MSEQALIGDSEKNDYKVVINHEEQYSLRSFAPSDERGNPAGWRDAGFTGSREACLAYIDENWTDMRPASLRTVLAAVSAAASSRESKKARL